MIDVAKHWNPKQAQLKTIVRNPERFGEAMELCLDMHSLVHTGEMSQAGFNTFEDSIWDGLEEVVLRALPKEEEASIAWHLWHLTRIEDITANILIAGETQVIDTGNWTGKLMVDTRDTGNAMTPCEIKAFSVKISMEALRDYRIAVGRKTRTVIKALKQGDMKKKVPPERLQRVFDEGGVVEGSRDLLDFWGRKDIAGILLMPITRHQIVHLNAALRNKSRLGGTTVSGQK